MPIEGYRNHPVECSRPSTLRARVVHSRHAAVSAAHSSTGSPVPRGTGRQRPLPLQTISLHPYQRSSGADLSRADVHFCSFEGFGDTGDIQKLEACEARGWKMEDGG